MNKFKVGDKVEVIKGGKGIIGGSIGKTTIITEVGGTYPGNGTPAVKTKDFINSAYEGWISEDSFKLIESREEVFYA